jgi:hypothetical protein
VLYIVPSRGRPNNVNELINAFRDTRNFMHLHVALDADDPELPGYHEVMKRQNTRNIDWFHCSILIRHGGDGMVGVLNRVVEKYVIPNTAYKYVGFMGDDHLPRTKDWDWELSEEIDKGNLVAYGNDLFQRGNLPTAVLLDANIVRNLGYMAPPTLRHLYVDNVWKLWGTRTGRMSYRDDIVVEHMHPVIYKAPTDARYDAVNNGEMWTRDEAAYHAYLADGLDTDLGKLRKLT